MLDREKHELILKNILIDFFKDPNIQTQLAFKGGTCLYLFYNLNRFSTDLDFNLLSETLSTDDITKILEQYLTIEDFMEKRNTWFWLGSHTAGKQKIKIEVSKRDYPDQYITKDYLGVTINTLKPEYMFAHKLCAITDRKILQNRDLFDAWFMFKQDWKPNDEIIKLRTGQTKKEYYQQLIVFIEKNAIAKSILSGLGEVLDEKQKQFVKVHLIDELIIQLKLRS